MDLEISEDTKQEYESRLTHGIEFKISNRIPLHSNLFCEPLEEELGSKYFRISRRINNGNDQCTELVAKFYKFPKAENDMEFKIDISDNEFILRVYDENKWSIIYENYVYNLDEVCRVWWGENIETNLRSKALQSLRKIGLVTSACLPIDFFRTLLKRTLEFLNFLRIEGFAYGNIHPHNIFVMDKACTVKFRRMKSWTYAERSQQDMERFILLVRYCANNGLRRDFFAKTNEYHICEEAEHFLSIFDSPSRIRSCYEVAFESNPMNMMKHPLFWDARMCLTYLRETYNLLTDCELTSSRAKYPLSVSQSISRVFSCLGADICAVAVGGSSTSRRQTISVITILGEIRNMDSHVPDAYTGYRHEIGTSAKDHPTEFWSAWRAKYPKLITGVHEVVLGYKDKLEPFFDDHLKNFYPSA